MIVYDLFSGTGSSTQACHESTPRGAKTGTQGLNSTEAGMMPPELGIELCELMETL